MRRPEQIGVDLVPEGMMAAVLRPPAGRDSDFNDWYDSEHAPARNDVPGFLTARRWRIVPGWDGADGIDAQKAAAENAQPLHYLATFDLDRVDVMDSPEYLRLRDLASDREREMVSALTSSDRRVYRARELPAWANGSDLDVCGPYLLAFWWEAEGDTGSISERWHSEDHVRALMDVPGVRRIRHFERVDEGRSGGRMALHDVDSLDVFTHPAWDFRDELSEDGQSMQLYRLWRRFDPVLG